MTIQQIGINTIQEAEEATDAHRNLHIDGQRIDNLCALVVLTQEDEITHLQRDGQKGTDGSQL